MWFFFVLFDIDQYSLLEVFYFSCFQVPIAILCAILFITLCVLIFYYYHVEYRAGMETAIVSLYLIYYFKVSNKFGKYCNHQLA